MNYRLKTLLLVDDSYDSLISENKPGNWMLRLEPGWKHYQELLIGYGIPHEVITIGSIQEKDLIRDTTLLFNTIIIACPADDIPVDILKLIKQCTDQGIRLLTDIATISHSALQPLFGVKLCRGARFGHQTITTPAGKALYKTRYYPFSSQGKDFGIRPLQRFFLQNWFSTKIDLHRNASAIAIFSSTQPAIIRFVYGKGENLLLNFSPSRVLNRSSPIHLLIKNFLTTEPSLPSVSLFLEKTGCLRLDDPGSCERVHLEEYNDGVMSPQLWKETLQIAQRHRAPLNVAYVPLWIDDGDKNLGELQYQGVIIKNRIPGKRYQSRDITYSRPDRPDSHDYAAEFYTLTGGVEKNNIVILAHGLTHLTTDEATWLKAPDRYNNMKWYREFREMADGRQPGQQEILRRLQKCRTMLQELFGTSPAVLVPPAHEMDENLPELARQAGFSYISSGRGHLLLDNHPMACDTLPGLYPEEVSRIEDTIMAGFPLTLVFHDYDIYRKGAGWLEEQICRLENFGIQQFISLEDLAFLLSARIESFLHGKEITTTIRFQSPPAEKNREQLIPLRIGGKVIAAEVHGVELTDGMFYGNGYTLVKIPVTASSNSTLTAIFTLA